MSHLSVRGNFKHVTMNARGILEKKKKHKTKDALTNNVTVPTYSTSTNSLNSPVNDNDS